MAKRSSARRATTSTKIIRAAAPIIKVSTPRAAPVKRPKGRRHHGGGGGGNLKTKMIAGGTGGLLLGFIDKHWTLPTVPLLGKAGTIAGVAYLVATNTKFKMAGDVALAAITIAGYELGSTGKVSGDAIMGGVAAET